MKKHINTSLFVLLILLMSSCDIKLSSPAEQEKGQFKKIESSGSTWMCENLNVEHFRNGEKIPYANTDLEWNLANKNGTPAYCYYINPVNNEKGGKLYNWYAIIDNRGIAPIGWHVPTEQDYWDYLINPQDKLKVVNFNLVRCGIRELNGQFTQLDDFSFFATATEADPDGYFIFGVNLSEGLFFPSLSSKEGGYPIRCISGELSKEQIISNSYYNREIIGKTYKIGKLEIARNNFPKTMKWKQATNECAKLGEGWRLPTIEELEIIINNEKLLKSLCPNSGRYRFWSSSFGNISGNGKRLIFEISSHNQTKITSIKTEWYNFEYGNIRAVRSILNR